MKQQDRKKRFKLLWAGVGLVLLAAVVYLVFQVSQWQAMQKEQDFIQTYVALEKGIPEEQIVESEDYQIDITGIEYGYVKSSYEDAKDEYSYCGYVIRIKFVNNSEETIKQYGDSLNGEWLREYKVNGEWYQARAESFADPLMFASDIEPGGEEEDVFLVGRVIDTIGGYPILYWDRVWDGEYRFLKKVAKDKYAAVYTTLERKGYEKKEKRITKKTLQSAGKGVSGDFGSDEDSDELSPILVRYHEPCEPTETLEKGKERWYEIGFWVERETAGVSEEDYLEDLILEYRVGKDWYRVAAPYEKTIGDDSDNREFSVKIKLYLFEKEKAFYRGQYRVLKKTEDGYLMGHMLVD